MQNSNNKKIIIKPEDIKNLKNQDNIKLVNTAMARSGLKDDDLRIQSNAKLFVKELTQLICEVIFMNDAYGEFKYQHLVTKEGEWIKGTHVLFRGLGLPPASEVDVCKKPTSCALNLDCESERYESKIPVKTIKVCDTINDFCYQTNWCSDSMLDEFKNAIKANLTTSNRIKVEELVEQEFNNSANFNDLMTIEIDSESTEKQIVKAIRRARLLLMTRNRLNIDGRLTRAMATDIWGAININSLVDYESVLICCANAESRLGTFYQRLLPTEFNDPKIVGILYVKNWFPIEFGNSRVYETACPNEPIWQKEFLYQQVALGALSFNSAIIIKLVSKQDLANSIKSKIDNIDSKEVTVNDANQPTAESAVTILIDKTIGDSLGDSLKRVITYSAFTAPTADVDGKITAKVEIQDKNDSSVLATSNQDFVVKLAS